MAVRVLMMLLGQEATDGGGRSGLQSSLGGCKESEGPGDLHLLLCLDPTQILLVYTHLKNLGSCCDMRRYEKD